jgi:hypothetical protein
MLEGKEVLLKGLIRRIGTSKETNIWSMNWIARNGMLRPMASTRSDSLSLGANSLTRCAGVGTVEATGSDAPGF